MHYEIESKIRRLIKDGYVAYDMTITFRQSDSMLDKYPDHVLYRTKDSHSTEISKAHHRADMLHKKYRLLLNKLSEHLLQTKNLTRKNHSANIPQVFYRMELSDIRNRRAAMENNKETKNICPLHYHALIMLKDSLSFRMKDFLGVDKLLEIDQSIQSSYIREIGRDCFDDIERWYRYTTKSESFLYTAYGGIYPSFKNRPTTM
jgi:hypothetical protein